MASLEQQVIPWNELEYLYTPVCSIRRTRSMNFEDSLTRLSSSSDSDDGALETCNGNGLEETEDIDGPLEMDFVDSDANSYRSNSPYFSSRFTFRHEISTTVTSVEPINITPVAKPTGSPANDKQKEKAAEVYRPQAQTLQILVKQKSLTIGDTKRAMSCSDLTREEITPSIPASISTDKIKTTIIDKSTTDIHKVTSSKKLSKILSYSSCDPNARNTHGDTPLHTFARKKDSKLLCTLLCTVKDVDIDARDADDNTALHLAAQNKDVESVMVLIAFGANMTIKNPHNQIPIDVVKVGPVKNLLKTFAFKPGFSALNRKRGYTLLCPDCTPDMIGYFLNWRREVSLSQKIEQEVEKMLHNEGMNATHDISEAGAAFIQLNHINCWKKTRGLLSHLGSRVLFLDGGGIRGLIEIEILMEIEYRTGRKIVELFDWIIGTSTGGILALALVYTKLSLKEVKCLYLRMRPLVFGGSFLKAAVRSSNMEKILRDIFQDTKMSSVTSPRVMIAAVNITTTSLDVEFFNNFNETKKHLFDVPVWMVARATTAAPKEFTSFNGYVDGGVKANNPCEFALSEISQYYKSHAQCPPHFPIMVSIGTGVEPVHKMDSDFRTSFTGEIKNVLTPKYLFDLLIYAISGSEEVAKKFENQCNLHGTPFFRFNPILSAEFKPTETNIDKIMKLILDTKEYLMNGNTLAKLFEMIELFDQLEDLETNEVDFSQNT